MIVADFGAGTGFYSLAAAQKVGEEGKVFAIDVQKELLDKIKINANSQQILNIEIIWGDIEKLGGTNLQDESVDAVIVANLIFQLEDKKSAIEEIKRILRTKGRVLVVDWTDSFEGMGPQPDKIITESSAKELFMNQGFEYEKSIEAGDNHYGIILRKV
jgi:ubiquinone/menaquinone biosynthesis C-methylase UbiE